MIKSIVDFFGKKSAARQDSYRIPFDKPTEWKQYLKDHGFVVIANYLNPQECEKHLSGMWDIMEKLSLGKLDRNLVESQSNPQNYPQRARGGMISYVGHSQTQWDLRKKCRPIFETVWQCKQVKSSFDGFCFMNGLIPMPPKPMTDFIHADQSPGIKDLWSYQGICSLTKSAEGEGGFVVVPDTHLIHSSFCQKKIDRDQLSKDSNFVMFNQKDFEDPLFQKCIKLNTEAGDFILFDSRTFHSNRYPQKPVLRVCTYICMLPKKVIPEGLEKFKRQAFDEKRTSTHHAGEGFNLFPVPYGLSEAKRQSIARANNVVFDKQIQDLL